MGLSLQDQLLKAGIVDKKQVKKVSQEKRANLKKNKGKTPPPETNQAQQDRLTLAQRNQELNRGINQEKERREKLSQVRQLIETNRLELDKYEEPYYFKIGKIIKKVYVNEDIARRLSQGELAIISFDNMFEIVPGKVAQQISDRDQGTLIVLHNTRS